MSDGLFLVQAALPGMHIFYQLAVYFGFDSNRCTDGLPPFTHRLLITWPYLLLFDFVIVFVIRIALEVLGTDYQLSLGYFLFLKVPGRFKGPSCLLYVFPLMWILYTTDFLYTKFKTITRYLGNNWEIFSRHFIL